MPDYQIIKMLPGNENFHLFSDLPKSLYPEKSQRFILGHDPVADENLHACLVLLEGDQAVARCAIYTKSGIEFEGKHACTVGSFECIDDVNAAAKLLNEASIRAKSMDFEFVIGPMEGSTWNNYRFSDHNQHPNFFMEPYHHEYYGKFWEDAGFNPIARYISNLDTHVKFDNERIAQWEQKFKEDGAIFRSLDLENLDSDLKKLAAFNNQAFKDNFLFTPIPEDDFVQKYRQLKHYFDPELIWIVEDENAEIQAISFSIPDYLDPTKKTLIIKSLARKKDTKFRGIGSYLAGKTYQIAAKRKFEKVIHALMIHDNHSVNISNNFEGDHYKSYTLYGKEL